MHFCFFAAQYLPTVGGVERYTHNLAKEVVCMGHTATVVTSALPGLPAEETSAEGIRILRLPSFLPLKGRFPWPKPGRTFRETAAAIWQSPIDICVINTRFYGLSLYAAKQAKHRGIPAIIIEHGSAYLTLGGGVVDAAAHIYEHIACRMARHYCRRFFGVSQVCGRWLQTFGITFEDVLYNAVDMTSLQPLVDSPACRFREKLGIPAGTPLIIYSGRFIPGKGVQELLDAYRLLRQGGDEAALILAGDGPEHAALAARPPQGVYFTGALSYAENVALVAEGDIFCLPTVSEGFSTVILEAAAAKTFIVTTATGGSPELILDETYGTILPDRRPETICRALTDALRDGPHRESAAEKTHGRLLAHFTWRQTAEKLVTIARQSSPTHPNSL